MKIICIGRNYAEHARELGNQVPEEPVIFMKPETALMATGQAFHFPSFTSDLHYECELVVRICKAGKQIAASDAPQFYDAVTLGIDFTARDVQDRLKKKGLPWEKAKAFDRSAVVGQWLPWESLSNTSNIHFTFFKNGQLVQEGFTKHMLFSINEIIEHVSLYFTLQPGDLLFTGTPAGVGPCAIADSFEGKLEGQPVLAMTVE